jgi:N utilization substance protein A
MNTKTQKKKEALRAADIVKALGGITKEKSINMDLVLDSLKEGLISAAKRILPYPINVEVDVDREKGTIEVYTRQIVVEEVEDPEMQIHIDDARDIDSEIQVGDELVEDLDIEQFGRTAIQTAKQVIMQRVREAERERIFTDYSERIGELITGTVQQIDKGNILINLGRTEALLPYREQIRKERWRQGDTIRACIIDVKDNLKGPQVIISRTSPLFLERLFELEVPEIFEKIVRIVRVVRAPGYRAKVAVTSSDSRVDPVGACVGMRGNRVQAIVRELSNERMDIINWTDELSILVRRVFSPAEVKRVLPVGDGKIVAIIQEEDLAQAIGREGQNIRLASKMLEKEIDVYGDEEFANFTDEQREEALREPEPELEEEEEGFAEEAMAEEELTEQDTAETEAETETEEEEEQEEQAEESAAIEEEEEEEPSRESGEDSVVQNLVEDAVEEPAEEEMQADDEAERKNED